MKEFVTWEEVENYTNEVTQFYKDKNITGVYGVPRGGLIFAVILSNKLKVPMLMSPVANCLIVDDICDSGETLLHYYKNSSGDKRNNYHISTMYYKENGLVKPEYWYKEKEDKWVVYPWEQ